jgi:hypothetical protein
MILTGWKAWAFAVLMLALAFGFGALMGVAVR